VVSIALSRDAWQAMREHAERAVPEECCGLLLGHGVSVTCAWPARNIDSRPRVRYLIDPADHFAAIREARARHLDVVGAYHSHPGTGAHRSASDADEAVPGFLYLIVGREGDTWALRAFAAEADGNFASCGLVFVP
jgi:proteasome lid subunit RPN8/RPN11